MPSTFPRKLTGSGSAALEVGKLEEAESNNRVNTLAPKQKSRTYKSFKKLSEISLLKKLNKNWN